MLRRIMARRPSARRVACALTLAFVAACGPLPRPPESHDESHDEPRAPSRASLVSPKRVPVEDDTAAAPSREITPPSAHHLSRARSRALLLTELTSLQELLRHTPLDASERSPLLRRIAEDYVELEAAARKDGSTNVVATARTNAIQTYIQLVREYPEYPQKDEVLFFLAKEYEQAGDNASARRTYYEITKLSDSKYVPHAYVAFGDMFFAEGQGDPSKLDLAIKAYELALSSPPPRNTVYAYASYEKARVLSQQGDRERARCAFEKTVQSTEMYPSLPDAAKIGDAARAGLAALGGEPAPKGHDGA